MHEESNYEHFSDEQLIKENKKLKDHLVEISDMVDRLIEKNKPKSNFRIKTLTNDRVPVEQVREREISNNKNILEMCNSEYQSLCLKEKHITKFNKEFLDESIDQIREEIQTTKLKNQKLKDKNRILGHSLTSVDDLF